MKRITLVFFLAVALTELLAVSFSWATLNFIAKPLIVISLAAYYLANTTHRRSLFLIAMAFCWLGDVLLMFQDDRPIFFMAGLGAFLTGHILYILSYQRLRSGTGSSALLGPQKIRFALPIILAGTGLVVVLYPKLGDLTVPVMVYALVITVMALQAAL
ncbi:MAG: lysoplasmalogenase [Cytophagales bacterium]|nr:lysoplasmalogenase [Cytophagales bacterium]